MQYRHFSIEERELLQTLRWQKRSVRAIAKTLNRSPSSVYRELHRTGAANQHYYIPRLAHERALAKRKCRGRTERLKNERVRFYVVAKLKLRWSPEQIAGRIRLDLGERISHEAIYQYIYAQINRDGWGFPKSGKEDLRSCLRRHRRHRMKKGLRRSERVLKPFGASIENRPKIVASRKRIGDWEGDTVESCHHQPGVNTLLERKTGLYLVTKVRDKTGRATVEAMQKRMAVIPGQFKHTLTLDNGPENRDWQLIEAETKLKTFYAHPYCSGERGANENTNGLLRDYYPKGTDFGMISEAELVVVEYRLNTRPRKRLGWRTPLEAWSVALQG